MKCKECGNTDFELVWYKPVVEEDTVISLLQCRQCKRVVMASEECEGEV